MGAQRWYRVLYIQVLIAVLVGVLIGWWFPPIGVSLKPLGDGFIKLVKMLIAPIVFCTVVHGIASMSDLKRLGRVGAKTLCYFEVVSTLALVIGLVVVNLLRPGDGFTPPGQTYQAVAESSPATGSTGAASKSSTGAAIEKTASLNTVDFLLNIIPQTLVGAFTSGDLLQVLFVAILTAIAIPRLPDQGALALRAIDYVAQLLFQIMQLLVKAAPIGALGAMAYTVGSHGLDALTNLVGLMLGFYLTAGLFIAVVLGSIARFSGYSLWRLLKYLKDELLLVLGTSSSETALPGLMQKLQRLGCEKATVGLVVPTGYSFNLDGTNIYMAMAAVFLAQATNTPLTLSQQVYLLLVAMLTSKGASGITGAGFVTLAATLQAVPSIPIESLALLLGIDRFMSECRAITNFIGNSVATIAISRWECEVSAEQLQQGLKS